MSKPVEITLSGVTILRQSDQTVDELVTENKAKYSDELGSIESSDLDRHVYEGGLKVWECAYDLAGHLDQIDIAGKSIIELGCGAGLPAITALKKGALKAVLQDYNQSVIDLVTKPNLTLNSIPESSASTIATSWASIANGSTDLPDKSFDLIFTSETIYDAADYPSLHDVMDRLLKLDGLILLAAKMVYFGKTGDYFRFLDYLEAQGKFKVIKTVPIAATVQRVIAHIVRV
uniref:protein-histidine N-methyltransferase n=1 Tax=Panagrellus redivivus TaxID=6233 RepID=A0A7E4VDG4_PANRE